MSDPKPTGAAGAAAPASIATGPTGATRASGLASGLGLGPSLGVGVGAGATYVAAGRSGFSFDSAALTKESPIPTQNLPTDLASLQQCVALLQVLSKLGARGVLSKEQKSVLKDLLFKQDGDVKDALTAAETDRGLAVQTLVARRFPHLRPAPVRIAATARTSPHAATGGSASTTRLAPAFAQLSVNTSVRAEPRRPLITEDSAPATAVTGTVSALGGPSSAASSGAGAGAVVGAGDKQGKRTRTPSFRQYGNSPAHVRSRLGPSPHAGSISSLHAVVVGSKRTTPAGSKRTTPAGTAGAGGLGAAAMGGAGAAGASAREGRTRPRFRPRGQRARTGAVTRQRGGAAGAASKAVTVDDPDEDVSMQPESTSPSGSGTRISVAVADGQVKSEAESGASAKPAVPKAAAKGARTKAKAGPASKARKAKGKTRRGRNRTEPRRWSTEEDDSLRTAVNRFGEKNWKSIAEHVPGRNHVQCLQRWKKVLRPGLVKGHWTGDEDALLRALVARGPKNWGQVASQIAGRTAKQCRERWCNHLDPRIKKGGWTALEDKALIEAHAHLGKRWAQISKYLPGRTENAVKIRWKSLTRRATGRGQEAARARELLAATQAEVEKYKKELAAKDPDTLKRLTQAASPLPGVDTTAIGGSGYSMSGGVPVAPATSSDRFSPFPPRSVKPGDGPAGQVQSLHSVNKLPLPPASAIVQLAQHEFSAYPTLGATGGATMKGGAEDGAGTPGSAGGAELNTPRAATMSLPRGPGPLMSMHGLPHGMGPLHGMAGLPGMPGIPGMPGLGMAGLAGLPGMAGMPPGMAGMAGMQLLGYPHGIAGGTTSESPRTSKGVTTPHSSGGNIMAAAPPLPPGAYGMSLGAVPRYPGTGGFRGGFDPAAGLGAGAGGALGGFQVGRINTDGSGTPAGSLPSPLHLTEQLMFGAGKGATPTNRGAASWAWLENALQSPSAVDKASLQQAAAAQAVTSAAAAQASRGEGADAAGGTGIPSDADLYQLEDLFGGSHGVDTPSLRLALGTTPSARRAAAGSGSGLGLGAPVATNGSASAGARGADGGTSGGAGAATTTGVSTAGTATATATGDEDGAPLFPFPHGFTPTHGYGH